MPPSIVKAVCQIMASFDSAIKHDQRNNHGGYSYASAEAIYSAISRRMGQAGLICFALEAAPVEFERITGVGGKTSQWAKFQFQFVLATESDTWTASNAIRTIMVQVLGPQTFQAAQSYAEKAFLKSLFKLPTGDLDLDGMPQAETLDDQAKLANETHTKKRISSSQAKKDGLQESFERLRNDIAMSASVEQLDYIFQENNLCGDGWTNYPGAWAKMLNEEYQYKRDDLKSKMGLV
jgi:hypothetical protein